MADHKIHDRSRIGRPAAGVVALLAVVIIAAIILSAGISAAFVAQTQIIISGHVEREQLVREALSACVEEALHRLKLDAAYLGGSIVLGGQTCTATIAGSGLTRIITVNAVDGQYSQTVTVDALLKQNGSGKAKGWTITNWSESVP
ncbi:MAG: hypothetical protein WCT10_04840 [Patescibacteria group bacterium]|jgi:uncharacterized protein YbjQ (UPF0145 family)